MPLDQFLIAPLTEGLQNDVEPWLIPDKAFAELKNSYVWRGRLRKRVGSRYTRPQTTPTAGYEQFASRLRINLGDTDGSGDISGTVPGAVFEPGQMFSIGTDLFTVVVVGTPGVMITNGAATTLTYNTTSGAFDIQGSLLTTACFFYPAQPVMGITQFENAAINDEDTVAFDTQFAYRFVGLGWERLGVSPAGEWAGTDSQFFWAENYRGTDSFDTILFVTNNNPTDHIRYWDGTIWTTFQPQYSTNAGDTIEGCRLIVSFKDRLLLLNTYERVNLTGDTSNHQNRVRFCQNGSPLEPGPPGAWFQNPETIGKGSWVDADTREAIISAKILRDRLIVFFERSTWELVYTGNKATPFVFQRINSELGVESTFSTVLFDKVLLGVGNVGIHACNGANVERIDEKIPQEVFKFHNGSQGVDRVHGIRHYELELVFWALPDADTDPVYPTKILVYNYKNRTWAINDDTVTAFGYLQNTDDLTWGAATMTWGEMLTRWRSGELQSEFPNVVGGNQEGYIFVLDDDEPTNAGALQITQLAHAAGIVTVTAINHNLQSGSFVNIQNVQGNDGTGPPPNPVDMNVEGIYEILGTPKPTTDTFAISVDNFNGIYSSGGTISRVSRVDIRTKEYNFYQKSGENVIIPKVSFYVKNTDTRVGNNFGQITVDFIPSSSDRSLTEDGVLSGALLGTNVLETTPYEDFPMENTQTRFWHVLYPQAEGETIQMRLYFTNEQMANEAISLKNFELNAMSIYARKLHRY